MAFVENFEKKQWYKTVVTKWDMTCLHVSIQWLLKLIESFLVFFGLQVNLSAQRKTSLCLWSLYHIGFICWHPVYHYYIVSCHFFPFPNRICNLSNSCYIFCSFLVCVKYFILLCICLVLSRLKSFLYILYLFDFSFPLVFLVFWHFNKAQLQLFVDQSFSAHSLILGI